ncbi:hypothetical protein SADUNF_Sadunf04G0120900 [Salix dunnii]|uniref:Uncharacterized protein n=1 Tax=Salix dunnii TaxID=1413687 RepID=A0A835KFU3_9ROSI|nr:hypothetical protein SADUNF_Sadunf04G0120900 [Salix dunnii]
MVVLMSSYSFSFGLEGLNGALKESFLIICFVVILAYFEYYTEFPRKEQKTTLHFFLHEIFSDEKPFYGQGSKIYQRNPVSKEEDREVAVVGGAIEQLFCVKMKNKNFVLD